MKYIPYRKIILQSPLDLKEVHDRLKGQVEPEKLRIIPSKKSKGYEGIVLSNHFDIIRIFKNRSDTYRPVIIGNMISNRQGTLIRIEMWPITSVFIFAGVIIITLLLIWGYVLIANHTMPILFQLRSLFIPLFCGIIYGMVLVFFNIECKRSVLFFNELFEIFSLSDSNTDKSII
jgi:hypothetical protein